MLIWWGRKKLNPHFLKEDKSRLTLHPGFGGRSRRRGAGEAAQGAGGAHHVRSLAGLQALALTIRLKHLSRYLNMDTSKIYILSIPPPVPSDEHLRLYEAPGGRGPGDPAVILVTTQVCLNSDKSLFV